MSTTCISTLASVSSSSVVRNAAVSSSREVADEADRVGDDDLALAREAQTARDRIQRREHLVCHVHVGLRQRLQQCALAGVGVADDREHRNVAPLASASAVLALATQLRELLLEPGHALAHTAPIGLELRLTGTAPSDAALQPRQRYVGALREARHVILELGQLDLELAVPRARPLGEDVEDQLCPVDHAQLHTLRQVACLRRV